MYSIMISAVLLPQFSEWLNEVSGCSRRTLRASDILSGLRVLESNIFLGIQAFRPWVPCGEFECQMVRWTLNHGTRTSILYQKNNMNTRQKITTKCFQLSCGLFKTVGGPTQLTVHCHYCHILLNSWKSMTVMDTQQLSYSFSVGTLTPMNNQKKKHHYCPLNQGHCTKPTKVNSATKSHLAKL
jgi:hypothetical protein